jgi:hypothetical protein
MSLGRPYRTNAAFSDTLRLSRRPGFAPDSPTRARAKPYGTACALGLAILANPTQATAASSWLSETLDLESIAYNIGVANSDRCDNPIMATGLVLHDVGSYDRSDRAGIEQRFALGMGFGVLGTVSHSGADRAGLRPGDEIVGIGSIDLERFATDAIVDRGDHARLTRFTDLLNQHLHTGPVTLRVRHGNTVRPVTLIGTPACGGRIAYVPGGPLNAWSDGDNVAVNTAMIHFTHNDDELAFVVAHEMAHNMLHHAARPGRPAAWTAMFGIGAIGIRREEIAADTYAVDLLDRTRFGTHGAVALIHRTWPMVLFDFGLTHPTAWYRASLVESRFDALAARHRAIDRWFAATERHDKRDQRLKIRATGNELPETPRLVASGTIAP